MSSCCDFFFLVNNMVTRLILIRHAQSEENLSGIVQGRGPGTPLTEKGRKQAEATAEKLKDVKIDVIYSSPKLRTMQTAEIINKYHDLEIIQDKNFVDRDFGVLIGTPNKRGNLTEEQKEMHRKRKSVEDYRIPGGESFDDVKKRVNESLQKILKEHKDQTIVIVSHGNPIRTMVCVLLDLTITDSYNMKSSLNCGYTELKINEKPELVTYFCDEHLSDI